MLSDNLGNIDNTVTSLAEVWIEIPLFHLMIHICSSLPLRKCGLKCTGRICSFHWSESLPLRKCGLKSLPFVNRPATLYVTSLAEVWIEIKIVCAVPTVILSLPLRKCGLKYCCRHNGVKHVLSLPLRKCGLKYIKRNTLANYEIVTSLAEVWIEIEGNEETIQELKCHFPCGSVDWNKWVFATVYVLCVTSLAEVWIEISQSFRHIHPVHRHFPCGSVDWNMRSTDVAIQLPVTSLAEVWIEITRRCRNITDWIRHFPCGSVDWNIRYRV